MINNSYLDNNNRIQILYKKEKFISNILEEISQVMLEKNITKDDLALKLNKPVKYINDIFTNVEMMSIEKIIYICFVLDCNPIIKLNNI